MAKIYERPTVTMKVTIELTEAEAGALDALFGSGSNWRKALCAIESRWQSTCWQYGLACGIMATWECALYSRLSWGAPCC
jgi:hypothetical protein